MGLCGMRVDSGEFFYLQGELHQDVTLIGLCRRYLLNYNVNPNQHKSVLMLKHWSVFLASLEAAKRNGRCYRNVVNISTRRSHDSRQSIRWAVYAVARRATVNYRGGGGGGAPLR